jgi:hypothetical protein
MFSAEGKKTWIYTHTPSYAFMALVKQGENVYLFGSLYWWKIPP